MWKLLEGINDQCVWKLSSLTKCRFSDFYSKAKDKEEVQQLKNELAAYQERLDKLHLKDYHVRDKATLGSAMRQVFDRIFFLLILLPLALPGFVLNWPGEY
jgi:hypothetical protein